MATYEPLYTNVTFDVARLEQDGYYYLLMNIDGAQVPVNAIKLGVIDELVENARLAAEQQAKDNPPAPAPQAAEPAPEPEPQTEAPAPAY